MYGEASFVLQTCTTTLHNYIGALDIKFKELYRLVEIQLKSFA